MFCLYPCGFLPGSPETSPKHVGSGTQNSPKVSRDVLTWIGVPSRVYFHLTPKDVIHISTCITKCLFYYNSKTTVLSCRKNITACKNFS